MRVMSKFSAAAAAILALCLTLSTLTACFNDESTPDKVTLDITEKTLYVGETLTLTATANKPGATLVWSSDDEEVAIVSRGLVTAVGEGEAMIKVKFGAVKAECLVTVKKPESITLDCTEITLTVDESFTLKAAASDEDAEVSWISNNTSVATVEDGTVTGVSAGTAVISANYGAAAATCTVRVNPKPSEQPEYTISLSESEKTVTAGDVFTLNATVTPAGEGTVVWSTSAPSVATVTNGTVKAVSAGNATITATYSTVSATCKVTVNKKPDAEPVYSISLDYKSKTVKEGESFTLKATATPAGSAVSWSSSDNTVATVSGGTVTAKKAGNAAITAKCGTATAVCAVTVTEKQPEGDVYELVFGSKETTCNNPGKWFYMCDGSNGTSYDFASKPKYINGTVTLAFNSVTTDTTKHFQLRIQPEFAIGTEYTVQFTVKLSAAGQVVYGIGNKTATAKLGAGESKTVSAHGTVTSGEPFVIEVLPSVRTAPITMTVSGVEFTKDTAVPDPTPDLTTLKGKYADFFPIGAAVQKSGFTNYSELMKNFNSITPENDMKWRWLEPTEGNYSWANADAIVDLANKMGAGVRGHCLLWYKSLPEWLNEKLTDKETALEYIDNHIETVMIHFGTGTAKEAIYAWDVCNEALRNEVTAAQLASGDIWRSNLTDAAAFGSGTVDWYSLCGTDFIKEAFRKADEMRTSLGLDNVKLYYNDYSLNNPNKRAACIQLVQMLRDEGIAIDGVGMQAHYRLSAYEGKEETFLKDFEDSVKAFTELGIDVQLTELDIRVYADDDEEQKDISAETFAKQGEMYGKILEICRKYAAPRKEGAGRVSSVTTWGISDLGTAWDTASHKEYPFIFDTNKKPKKAFEEMMNF